MYSKLSTMPPSSASKKTQQRAMMVGAPPSSGGGGGGTIIRRGSGIGTTNNSNNNNNNNNSNNSSGLASLGLGTIAGGAVGMDGSAASTKGNKRSLSSSALPFASAVHVSTRAQVASAAHKGPLAVCAFVALLVLTIWPIPHYVYTDPSKPSYASAMIVTFASGAATSNRKVPTKPQDQIDAAKRILIHEFALASESISSYVRSSSSPSLTIELFEKSTSTSDKNNNDAVELVWIERYNGEPGHSHFCISNNDNNQQRQQQPNPQQQDPPQPPEKDPLINPFYEFCHKVQQYQDQGIVASIVEHTYQQAIQDDSSKVSITAKNQKLMSQTTATGVKSLGVKNGNNNKGGGGGGRLRS